MKHINILDEDHDKVCHKPDVVELGDSWVCRTCLSGGSETVYPIYNSKGKTKELKSE